MKKIRLIVFLDCILAVVLFGFVLQQYGPDSVMETGKRSSMKDYDGKLFKAVGTGCSQTGWKGKKSWQIIY